MSRVFHCPFVALLFISVAFSFFLKLSYNECMKTILQRYLLPAMLLLFCPPFAMILWYTNVYLDASFILLFQYIQENGMGGLLQDAWFSRFWGSGVAWTIILVFAIIQVLLMRILPGKTYQGSRTPHNNVPEYKNNGVLSYLISFALFLSGGLVFKWFSPSIIYDNLGEILAALNISALLFCLMLYWKGRLAPSSSDHGLSGSFIFDYYWGTELHPRIFGIDVKMFTNCRFGMTAWALFVLSYAFAQKNIIGYMDYGIWVSAILIDIYLLKFFIWEAGYMRSMDIAVDRAGFYICWGCLVWVPALYTSPVLFMVNHPSGISLSTALLIFILGNIAIFTNFWADKQRQTVRETNGKCKIWGKEPTLIHAKYTTEDGETMSSILLASGFWGISRHFHYIPELSAAFIWSMSSGFHYFMPFLYFVFLTILLVHRSIRDEKKCQLKYGEYWKEYKKKVPYKLVPFVF